MDRSRPPLRFGLFIAPHHPAKENPTLALQRDVELVQYIEDLGFDEAWIGEHHSAGWEYIGSPGGVHRVRGREDDAGSSSARAWSRCPTTTRSWPPSGWCCSTTSRGAA